MMKLARLYDRLTVWERIPLLIGADARKDEVEYRRLFEASSIKEWHFSEHLLDEMALHTLALIYVTEQLEAAGVYFFALTRDDDPGLWLLAAEVSAYFFAANAEAWRRFCGELKIDARTLTAGNHHGWFLSFCEERMPQNAPTAEALQARLKEHGREVAEVVTVDSLLTSWRDTLKAMRRQAPVGGER